MTGPTEDAARVREEAFSRLRGFTRSEGLKNSRRRDLVLEHFLRMPGHVSATDVHDEVRRADPTIGRTTVYRALRLFCIAGIATSIELRDGLTRFEPALFRGHHDHLICVGCGRIDEFLSHEVEEQQEQIAAEYGYRLLSHRHQLYGMCAECHEEEPTEA